MLALNRTHSLQTESRALSGDSCYGKVRGSLPPVLQNMTARSDFGYTETLWSYLYNVTIATHEPVGFCDKQLYIWWSLCMHLGTFWDTSGNTDPQVTR